ncbi:MAG: DUF4349 domain-containing protein [Desulfobacteraceae bacterium]
MSLDSLKTLFGCICLGMIVLLFSGCAKKAVEHYAPVENQATGRAKPASSPAAMVAGGRDAFKPAPEMPLSSAAPVRERMIHHDGFIRLRSPRPRKIVDDATRMVEARGGYVERVDAGQAVFRVPVKAFKGVFDQLLKLGPVLEQSVRTEDITEAFMDVDLRLSIARNTRRRLVELLAKAKSEKEKIRILREIERLSTSIETLSAQRKRLLSKARFSRITLHIEALRAETSNIQRERIEAFRWIHQLSPFDDKVPGSGKPLKFDLPKGMVALNAKGLWVAESADGAFLRASRHELQPAGDTAFWLEAVKLRLRPEYAKVQVLDAGEFKLLRMEDRSETPFIYLVGLHVTARNVLELVEVYFASSSQESRYKETILAVIQGGAR